jgi:hypothetical protein
MDSKHRKTAALKAKETLPPSPRTFLGKRLASKRKKILTAGLPLLGWDGLERELADRRGGQG